jgi:hypothetical protein
LPTFVVGGVSDDRHSNRSEVESFLIFISFICAYNVWVISFPFPLSSPLPLASWQKLFCPYL